MTLSCPNAARRSKAELPEWHDVRKKKPPAYCYLEVANNDLSTTMFAWTDSRAKDWYCGGYGGFGCLIWKVSHWRRLKRLENIISKEIMQEAIKLIRKRK